MALHYAVYARLVWQCGNLRCIALQLFAAIRTGNGEYLV